MAGTGIRWVLIVLQKILMPVVARLTCQTGWRRWFYEHITHCSYCLTAKITLRYIGD
jgi:hypothetical protein